MSSQARNARRSPRIVILGGGIGGLAAAIALGKAGLDVRVHERAALLGDVGAGLVLWANAMRVLRELGLADEVIRHGEATRRGEVRRHDGRVLASSLPGELDAEMGVPTVAIHRAALHRALLSALPEGTVRLGSRCDRIEERGDGVALCFADGSSDEGDLLVGADGIHSLARGHLFPDAQPRYSGYTAWRGATHTRSGAEGGLSTESWGRGHRFGVIRLDAERVYWFATANTPEGHLVAQQDRRSHLLQRFGNWHQPIPALLEQTDTADILQNDIHDLPPMERWSRGRITLLGDAAHATTPNLGQGACMAIESAWVLARELARNHDHASAFRAYEEARRRRTRFITDTSWQVGRIGQFENPIACALRNLAVRTTPGRVAKAQLRSIVAGGPA